MPGKLVIWNEILVSLPDRVAREGGRGPGQPEGRASRSG